MPRTLPLLVVFALSGAGSLVVETVWMRWFQDWLGATPPATAATVTAFFAGSAIGAWLGARLARRTGTRAAALRLYAGAEVAAALAALAMPLLLEAAASGLGMVYDATPPWMLHAVRFAAALLVTLPAAAAYGATLPLMTAAAVSSPREIGRIVTTLYAANLAGAVCGVAVATWWGPPMVGVRATYAIGLGLSVLAALGALLLRRPTATPHALEEDGAGGEWPSSETIALSALSGFVTLAAQVLLVRAVAHVVNQSVTAFGAVLIAVLVCLATGAFVVATLRARTLAGSRAIVGWACAAAAIGFALAPACLHRVTGGLGYVGATDAIPYALVVLATVLVAVGPALVAAGCIWPATLALAGDVGGEGAKEDAGTAGYRVGILAVANAMGAVVGGVVTPFVVLPALGPWGGFLVIGAASALAAIALPRDDRRLPEVLRRRRVGDWLRPGIVLGAALLVLLAANPLTLPLAPRAAGERVLEEHSGAAGTVSVVERAGERLLRLDGHYALGGTGELVHEARQGHVPLLLHGRPKRVAFIGTATGITAGAALDHDVDAVTLIEIVPEVAHAAAAHFADTNRGIYTDARSHVVLDDARNYWRQTPDRYDVIVADLFVPWQAGTGALYAREHFQAMRDRLEPGGLMAQWLPIYQLSAAELRTIVATFTDVFPIAAVFRGDFFATFPVVALVGWRDGPAPATDVAAAVRRLAARGVRDRWLTDPVAFFALYLAPLDPSTYDGVPRNLLDRPWIEYEAAARHAGGERGKLDALRGLAWLAQVDAWQAAAPEPDALYPSLPPAARRARVGGDALQRAGALWAAGRAADAARALEIAADALPPSVVAEAPEDQSAVDVWR
ncbi:MAG TPA: fused MFS/spermidine synthase [Candidatus Binatia bacterium]|jgi:spermidine synthase|nr:fused MFS/spermidine synthase [Candidatus Binatia bacterium]